MRSLARACAIALLATACGSGGGGGKPPDPKPYDAGPPPIDAQTGDLRTGDVLTGSGKLQGGTIKMEIEVGGGVTPSTTQGGTVKVEPGSATSP